MRDDIDNAMRAWDDYINNDEGTETMINEAQYETMIRKALESDNGEEVREYLTTTCPECDKEVTPDVERETRENGLYHRMMDNWVIVGCEGYRVVNPNIVGQSSPYWHDWRI